MLSSTNVLTAHAVLMLPGMTKTEYGINVGGGEYLATDTKTGTGWYQSGKQEGYPFCTVKKTITVIKVGKPKSSERIYLDCYLTDYIKTHEESEWPSFIITGSDGVPFYLYDFGDLDTQGHFYRYTKWCYDEETGWWIRDKAYKGSKVPSYGFSDSAIAKAEAEKAQMIEELKEDIATGEVVENGTPVEPIVPDYIDDWVDSDDVVAVEEGVKTITHPDGRIEYSYPHNEHRDKIISYPDGHWEYYCDEEIIRIEYPDGRIEYPDGRVKYPDGRTEYPDGRIEYPDGRIVYPDGHVEYKGADVNTLGATVTFKTDCIKTKKNNAAQKPLPKSVKVGKKALKRNKNYTVSYEKYADGWKTVDAVTDEGIYRIVITGTGDYKCEYKKTLYVTADRTIKAMSSVSVKVNKMPYTGEPVTSGVIKTAKIGKRTLTEGTDYTVTYTNNTDSGTAQVTLTAIEGSGLLGTKTVNFTITGNKMSKVKVTGISSLTYSPNETMEQDMSNVKLTYNGTQLNKDTDFTVSYLNNTKAGTAKIVFTGKGLYNGTLTKSFKIAKAALSESMLDEESKSIEVTYTGKVIKPDITLKNGDTTLKKGTDYTLTYKNNKKVSTAAAPAQITVKGKGSYTGSFKLNFTIIEKKNDNTENPKAKNTKPDAEDPTKEGPVEDDETVTEEEPATDEPTEEDPEAEDPTEEEPAADEPTGEDPAADEPTEDEPVTDEPTEDEPVADEPTEDEPRADEPTEEEPVADEPTEGEPVADEPMGEEPVIDEPTEEDPAAEDPTEGEPVTDKATIDEPATEDTVSSENAEPEAVALRSFHGQSVAEGNPVFFWN